MPAPVLKKSGYLPSLDGWRAIAVLCVMIAHDFPHHIGPLHLETLKSTSGHGVDLFFAISGLLICTRILEEETQLGRLNLKGFYIRRICRIQPAAWTYLAAVALLTCIGWIHQAWRFWFGAFFLYRNYQLNVTDAAISAGGFFTGHFWTLAVEEHFYLLLSLLLFFIRKRRELWMFLLYLVCIGWRPFFPAYVNHAGVISDYRYTEFKIYLLLGAAFLAVLLQRPRIRHFVEAWMKPWAVTLCAAILFVAYRLLRVYLMRRGFSLPTMGRDDALPQLFPFWVIATMVHAQSWTTRVLELPLLRWIGRLSYSLYLWHVLFFRGAWPGEIPQPPSPLLYLSHWPWNFVAAFACASLCYYFIEKPFMRLGHRLAPPATPGRKDLMAEPSVELALEPIS